MTLPTHTLPPVTYETLSKDPAFIAAQEALVQTLRNARQNQWPPDGCVQDELVRCKVAQILHDVLVPYTCEINAHIARFHEQLVARLDSTIAQHVWGNPPGQVITPLPALIHDGLKLEYDHFKVLLDIKPFHPNDVNVSFANNAIQVQARRQNGADVQQLCRQYFLPRPARLELLQYCVSPDGLLCISAPWKC